VVGSESLKRYGSQPIASLPRFWRVAVTCRRCERRNEVPVAYLVQVGKIDPAHSLADFAHGLRCSICNSRRVVVAIEGTAIEPRRPVAPDYRIGGARSG
jgi:hypothetical protein